MCGHEVSCHKRQGDDQLLVETGNSNSSLLTSYSFPVRVIRLKENKMLLFIRFQVLCYIR